MATGRLTKRAVEAVEIPPVSKRAYLWDDRLKGFGVMVTPAGTRCYLIQYKLGGRAGTTRRFSIGHHGNPWTTDLARDRAAELLEMVRRGVDPMDAERDSAAVAAERRKVDQELGFSTFADVFLQKHVDDRKLRSADDIKGVFRRDLKPWFKDKPLHKIDRDDIHELLDHVGEAHSTLGDLLDAMAIVEAGCAVDLSTINVSPAVLRALDQIGEREGA